MAAFLTAEKLRTQDGVLHGCMAGFVLKNTLSDSGTVTRGICRVTEEGLLRQVIETYEIRKEMGSIAQGVQKGEPVILNQQSLVSMNMWGLTPEFIGLLEEGLRSFSGILREMRKRQSIFSRFILMNFLRTVR